MSRIEPGWYRDPADPTTQRFWDGEQWVGKAVPADATPPETPEPEPEPAPEPEPEPEPELDPARGASRAGRPPAPLPRTLDPKKVDEIMAGRTIANPGLRLVARIIDIIAVLLLNVVVNGWFVYQYVQEVTPAIRRILSDPTADPMSLKLPDRAYDLQFLILFIGMLVWFAYEVPATVSSGQTLGKRLMGIKVATLIGERLRWSAVISRWSLLMLPMACFPFGLIMSVVDGLWCTVDRPFRQCIHDKSAFTMVVTADTPTTSPKET